MRLVPASERKDGIFESLGRRRARTIRFTGQPSSKLPPEVVDRNRRGPSLRGKQLRKKGTVPFATTVEHAMRAVQPFARHNAVPTTERPFPFPFGGPDPPDSTTAESRLRDV